MSLSKLFTPVKNRLQPHVNRFRESLAYENALAQLALLGVICGLLTGLVISAFRLLIMLPLQYALPGGNAENFEALPAVMHFSLPAGGALLLGIALYLVCKGTPKAGIPHVIECLNKHNGHLPLKNALVQFFAASFAIISGQSAGREGPAVHLGSASGSLLGQYLQLPNNSIRVLVGSGTAAAIACSFNTPIAGVIFAMEVVLMEYSIAGFTPIILSAVSGTLVSRLIFGPEPLFGIPPIEMQSLTELPLAILLGLASGALASLFVIVQTQCIKLQRYHLILRMSFAGLCTGTLALLLPQILGMGYDTINLAFVGQFGAVMLLAIALTKLLATAISCGLGMPIGIIGPSMFIGACLGGAVADIASQVFPQVQFSEGFYVLLGMGAVMGAVLNAPLAALLALLELTRNTHIIFPGMLTIIAATLTTSQLFRQNSAHQTTLALAGQYLQHSPLHQILQRVGVASIMNQSVRSCPEFLGAEEFRALRNEAPRWLIVGDQQQLIRSNELTDIEADTDDSEQEQQISLLSPPITIYKARSLDSRASLQQAWDIITREGLDALIIRSPSRPRNDRSSIIGIVSRQDIESYYSRPR